uniref:DUF6290 family protein n=1 Tax=Vaginimicrobium propionicum TaxID=1871034 RepID=UPI0009711FF1|nr:DUF6290 family protein [Vaginimicrobium propionicum]
MATVNIELTDEELSVLKHYANARNLSLAAAIRKKAIESLDDEHDLELIARYEQQKLLGNLELNSHKDVWAEIGV